MIQLHSDQLKAVLESSGPVEFVDPNTNERFVLIRAEFYERIRNLLEYDDPNDAETNVIIQQMGKSAGWEDPTSDDLI